MAQPSMMPTTQIPTKQNSEDAISIATNALTQSNGDAKAAFYSLAQQKGVDPDAVLKSINSMGDPKKLMMSMLQSNPRIGNLFKLFGVMK